jgi:hypothetical protein
MELRGGAALPATRSSRSWSSSGQELGSGVPRGSCWGGVLVERALRSNLVRRVEDCTCGDFVRCQRCTNCSSGVQCSDQGFAFRCGSCRGTGWVHGSAADVIVGIRIEMREERQR